MSKDKTKEIINRMVEAGYDSYMGSDTQIAINFEILEELKELNKYFRSRRVDR